MFLDFPDTKGNSHGARGIGEIGTAGCASAAANAVYHAIQHASAHYRFALKTYLVQRCSRRHYTYSLEGMEQSARKE